MNTQLTSFLFPLPPDTLHSLLLQVPGHHGQRALPLPELRLQPGRAAAAAAEAPAADGLLELFGQRGVQGGESRALLLKEGGRGAAEGEGWEGRNRWERTGQVLKLFPTLFPASPSTRSLSLLNPATSCRHLISQALGPTDYRCRRCLLMDASMQAGCFRCIAGGGDADLCVSCLEPGCFECVSNPLLDPKLKT
jgi:hypothetical protein